MSAIPSFAKKSFNKANKKLVQDENELFETEKQIDELLKKKREIKERICKDKQNKVVTGMLYYTEEKRAALLDKAVNLSYSEQTIARLRMYDKSQWNADIIDENTIADFESIEKFVDDHTSPWENNIFSKIGQIIDHNE